MSSMRDQPERDHTGWRPTGGIEIIAGTPPGGGQDRAARALASALDETSDLDVRVLNVPGRGGGNAWDVLCTHGGDGHRLSISSPTLLTNRLTGVSDLARDTLTQIAMLYSEYIVFAVPVASSLESADDLTRSLSSPHPPTISLATARGNINHLALAYLCQHQGVEPGGIELSIFNSAPEAIADGLTHPAGVIAVSAASVVPEYLAGTLRPLGVSSPNRLGAPLEAIPTFCELGVDCTIGVWRGVVGPPRLSPDVVSFWCESIGQAMNAPSWSAALEKHVWTPMALGPAATVEFIQAQDKQMSTALTDFGLLD